MIGSPTAAPPLRRPVAPATPRPEYGGLLVMALRAAEEHVLVVVGEADVSTADQLRDHLIDALAGQPPAVRVELGGLEFCDLHGLDALHDAQFVAAYAGVPLSLSGMSAQLAWLDRTFPPHHRTTSTDPDPATAAPSTATGSSADAHLPASAIWP